MKPSNQVKEAYANQYENSIIEWRRSGAWFKAKNIIELSKETPIKSVLEVGSGEGSVLEWLSKWNFCTNLNAIEISESGVDIIKSKNIEHLKSVLIFDGYKIPYPDNHFDLVICSHVIEHVEYERILLREIKRVSKHQIFEVPIDFSLNVDEKVKHFLNYGHINIYTPALFRFLLLSENFVIVHGKCNKYESSLLPFLYKPSTIKMFKMKIRYFIFNSIPFLLKLKPSSYAVLTTKNESELSIFNN
jgi:ubiquinone/menaquinone biosynthesis C-methylase UbiE